MNDGLKNTLDVLAGTVNESAVAVLVPALNSPNAKIGEGVLRSLLARRSTTGGREVIRRWDKLSQNWKDIVAEHPSWITQSVRDAILSTDDRLCINGCDVLLTTREYDLVPALVNASEASSEVHADRAAETLLHLCEHLYEELAAPRDYENRRDPKMVRKHVLASLGQSVLRFDQHQRKEILESFLMLANRDDATLKRILQDPHDKSYLDMLDLLTHSPRLGVMRLLLNYLEDPDAPLAALHAMAHRIDIEFINRLLDKVGLDPPPQTKLNLKRIEQIVWLRGDLSLLDVFEEKQQEQAIYLAKISGMKRLEVFESIKYVLAKGNVGGRKAACEALVEYKGADANNLVLLALDDPDPVVQAIALRQVRDRGIPGALSRLLAGVESQHPQVREAAQQSLSEFSFRRYLAAFDMLDEDVRSTTGELVRKVDLTAVDSLRSELSAASRTRRLRALKVAPAMGVVRELEALVIHLMHDKDHFVRSEAANALACCDTPTTQQALRQALMDRSVMVQEAAEQALQQFAPAARQVSEELSSETGTAVDTAEHFKDESNEPQQQETSQ